MPFNQYFYPFTIIISQQNHHIIHINHTKLYNKQRNFNMIDKQTQLTYLNESLRQDADQIWFAIHLEDIQSQQQNNNFNLIKYSIMLRKTSNSLKKSQSRIQLRDKKRQKKTVCMLCEAQDPLIQNQNIIRTQIFIKYSASQNFFYSKHINDILQNQSTITTILVKDYQIFDMLQDRLKNYFKRRDYTNQLIQLTEYYKYYKDLPRIHMVDIQNIFRRHHDAKRMIEYYRLKSLLKIGTDLSQKCAQNMLLKKQRLQNENILKQLQFSSRKNLLENHQNQSLSIIYIKQKLAAIIKSDTYSKNFNIQKLDNEFHFQKKQTSSNYKKMIIEDVSDIVSDQILKQKNFIKKKVVSPQNIEPVVPVKKQHNKICRKRNSMEYLRSERSDHQIKPIKRRSQQHNFGKQFQKQYTQLKTKKVHKNKETLKKQLKQFLISTDSSFQKLKLKLLTVPSSQIKKEKIDIEKDKNIKGKHNRIASEQFTLKCSEIENAKKEKVKITINQNNVFNIVLDGKNKVNPNIKAITSNKFLKKPNKI